MPTSPASPSNPGLYVYAPCNARNRWSPGAPTPVPRAHYVCRCGQSNAALGTDEVRALIHEYLTHMKTAHPDLREASKRQTERAA